MKKRQNMQVWLSICSLLRSFGNSLPRPVKGIAKLNTYQIRSFEQFAEAGKRHNTT